MYPPTAVWASSPKTPVALEFDQVAHAKVGAGGSVAMPLVLVVSRQEDGAAGALRRTIRRNGTVIAEATEMHPHRSNGRTEEPGDASTHSPTTALAMSVLLAEGTYVDRVEATVKVRGASQTMTVRNERFFDFSRGVITPLNRERCSAELLPVGSGFGEDRAPVIRLVGLQAH